MQLDNISVGKNIAKFRRLKDVKAADIAEQIGLKEAAYTKYERGETAITIDFIQKVSEALNIDPIQLITTSPSNFLENIQHSSIAIQENSTFQTANQQHSETMLQLMDSVIKLNERLIALQEKK